jgi:hypothetical protein
MYAESENRFFNLETGYSFSFDTTTGSLRVGLASGFDREYRKISSTPAMSNDDVTFLGRQMP